MNHLPERSALLTDLYQLTMAYGYWHNQQHEKDAVFHLFFRKNPFQGGYAVCGGLDEVIRYIKGFHFSENDLQYLATLKGNDDRPLFSAEFLEYLSALRFTGNLKAIPEGTVVFPNEPLVRIEAPLIQAQLLETALLTLINFPTLIATKSARVCQAAQGDPVLEFGLRRAQGVNGGLTASRAAYLGGCIGTSNVLAGQRYGIPIKGTHAHSWVMSFSTERQSFEAYAKALPNNCIFLIDTYDSLQGVKEAILVGQELRKQGHHMVGIRLDSGNLLDLSIEARKMLDKANMQHASIVASNDLNEHEIHRLKSEGATINVWGVGTQLATAYDQPSLGGVYKLAAIRGSDGQWDHKIKLSNDAIKVSNPGLQQVFRYEAGGNFLGDVIFHEPWETETGSSPEFLGSNFSALGIEASPLLESIFEGGELVYQVPTLEQSRHKLQLQLQKLPKKYQRISNAEEYPVELEPRLAALKDQLIKQLGQS